MVFKITQGDTSPSLVTTLWGGSDSIDLSNVKEVKFIMENRYEKVVIDQGLQENVNLVDASDGTVEYVFGDGQTDDVGSYSAEFEVEFNNGSVETFPTGDNKITVEVVEQVA